MDLTSSLSFGDTIKASIRFLTQSGDLLSCCKKPKERTGEIGLEKNDFIGLLHWFLVATDRIARLSQTVDRGLQIPKVDSCSLPSACQPVDLASPEAGL